jgi:hypothetical protein
MAEKKIKTKEERIKSEKSRLNKIYKDIEEKRKNTVQGLIERAAYMRVSIEDMEKDLDENGFTEWFQQGENQKPYQRKRPIADMYNQMNNSYQKCINQLTNLLPKDDAKPVIKSDGFDDFVDSREDV